MAMMGIEPDKPIDILMLINAKQLQVIVDRLLTIYEKNSSFGLKLTKALDMLPQLKVNKAAKLIEEVLVSKNLDDELLRQHEEILLEAREIGKDYLESFRKGVIPEFILQIPSISMNYK